MSSGARTPPGEDPGQRVREPSAGGTTAEPAAGGTTAEPAAGRTTAEPAAGRTASASGRQPAGNMLPARPRRRFVGERVLTRLIATCGIVAIGVAIAAILASSKTQGWIIGLVVAIVSVVLSAILWSSKQL